MLGIAVPVAAPEAGCSTGLHEGGFPIVLSQPPLATPVMESWVAPTTVQQLPTVSLALSMQAPELPQAHICT